MTEGAEEEERDGERTGASITRLATCKWGPGGTLLRQSGDAYYSSAVPMSYASRSPIDHRAPFEKSLLFGSALPAVQCRRWRR